MVQKVPGPKKSFVEDLPAHGGVDFLGPGTFLSLWRAWCEGRVRDADYVLCFVAMGAWLRRADWLNARLEVQERVERHLLEGEFPAAAFAVCGKALKAQPAGVWMALSAWREGDYPIQLSKAVPTPLELLRVQAEGRRVVSLDLQDGDCGFRPDGKRDRWEFCLHDLLHAHHFFCNKEHQAGQLGFYRKLVDAVDAVVLGRRLGQDAVFAADFDYVVADMNAHVVHLLKTLKARWLEHELRQQGLPADSVLPELVRSRWEEDLRQLGRIWRMPDTVLSAWLELNTPGWTEARAIELNQFFVAAGG